MPPVFPVVDGKRDAPPRVAFSRQAV